MNRTDRSVHLSLLPCAVLASLAVAVSAARAEDPAAALTEAVNQEFTLGKSQVVTLDLNAQVGEPLEVAVPVGDELFVLQLSPESVRSPDYEVRIQLGDGAYQTVEPEASRTLRGTVVGLDGAVVAGSLLDGGLVARILLADGTSYWVEPLAGRVAGAGAGMHVVYSTRDVIPSGGTCGVTGGAAPLDLGGVDTTLRGNMPCGGDLCIAQLACDADVEYFNRYGTVGNVETRINLVINTINVQYERDLQIRHVITTIIVRTAEPDPYTTTDPEALLGQFQNHWNQQQQGIVRDVAHLFTGKNMAGNVIGIAYLAQVCNLGSAYGLVESDCCGGLSCASDLSAHELGHNWSADHCECPGWTMNPSITCANRFHATEDIPGMMGFRDSRACLEGLNVPPFNNDCPDRQLIAASTRPINTVNATMDGIDPPGTCNEGGGVQIDNDIWYCYVAICDGTGTVDLCDVTNFNTRVAVYSGCTCPASNDNLVGCDDDGCGMANGPSLATFPTTFGGSYLIRIGGPVEGTGQMTVSCEVGGGEVDANIIDAKSLLLHAALELTIDLDDSNGIEPRLGGASKIAVQMSENMEVGTVIAGNVQMACAVGAPPAVSAVTLMNNDTVVVELASGISDQNCCTLSFGGMETDTGGVVLDSLSVTTLQGDLDFNGGVTGGDSLLIKTHFGEVAGVNLSHPKFDYDRNGVVTGADFSLIKPLLGHQPLGACP